jgi:two-component system, LytTR family, sensor kinase
MRLSDMMDYMLYESGDAKLPLQKDIDNLVNYVEIERIRQGNNAKITFTAEGETTGLTIIPLLLLPLLENGFKHGINKEAGGAYLTAAVRVKNDAVHFSAVNNKPALLITGEPGHGIGLENLKKRLQLHYPGKHALVFQENEDSFTASLKIELA